MTDFGWAIAQTQEAAGKNLQAIQQPQKPNNPIRKGV